MKKAIKVVLQNGYCLEGITGFSMSISNSIFDEEVIRGSFSYGISVPKTAGNVVNLGFYHIPEAVVDMDRKLNVTIGFGNYQIPGTLVVISADERNYRVTILFGISNLVNVLENSLLSETELPDYEMVTEDPFLDATLSEVFINPTLYPAYLRAVAIRLGELNDSSYPDEYICFPHFQRGGSNITNPLLPRHQNKIRLTLDAGDNVEAQEADLYNGITPAFFLMKLFKTALQQKGFDLNGVFLDAPFIDRLLTFGTKEVAHERRYVNLGTTATIGYSGIYRDIKFDTEFNPQPCLPEISLLQILKKLKAHFSIPLYVNLYNKEIMMDTWDSVFADPAIVDWTGKFEKWVEIKDGKLDGQDFGYSIESDAWAEKSINSISEYTYKGAVNDLDDYVAISNKGPKEIYYVKSQGMYFANAGDLLAYTPIGHNAFGRFTGEGELKRSFILPTLDDNNQFGLTLDEGGVNEGKTYNLFEYYSNHEYQKPVIEYTGSDNKEFRIAFWMGKLYGIAESERPYYHVASSVGEPITLDEFYNTFELPKPDFSLFIESEEGRPYVEDKPGVAAKFGGRYFEMMSQTKKLKGKFRLTEADLIDLKPTSKIRVGNNLYFYDQIRGSFPVTETFDVDMYWIPPGIVVPETIVSDGPTLGNGAGKGGTASAGGSGGSSGGGGGGGTGADGKTILNGTGVPDPELGTDEDFYLDTATYIFYGPKTAGAWGSGVSLVGPTGNGISSYSYNAGTGVLTITNTDATSYSTGDLRGPSGAPGPIGPNGPTGETGAEGENNTNHIFNFLNFA